MLHDLQWLPVDMQITYTVLLYTLIQKVVKMYLKNKLKYIYIHTYNNIIEYYKINKSYKCVYILSETMLRQKHYRYHVITQNTVIYIIYEPFGNIDTI